MTEDEARGVRAEVKETPKVRFEGFGFSTSHEITVLVLREGTTAAMEFESRYEWDNYRGYLRLEQEEAMSPMSQAASVR